MSRRVATPGDSQRPRLDAVQDWSVPTPESEGLPYYLAALRSNIWLIVVTVAICLGAAILYLSQAHKVYKAEADLLITPIARDNQTLTELGLPQASSDPARDVETMARLIQIPRVARRVIERLGLDTTPSELLANIDTAPVASSNIVSVVARAGDPMQAARIANAFSAASVRDRTERMHAQLDAVIPRLAKQIDQLKPSEQAAREELLQRLRDLQTLRALNDPTIHFESLAEPNTTPISPRPVLSIAAAIIAGLLVGGAVVFGSQVLDPRLRREEQLRRYAIPILARVPLERRINPLGRLSTGGRRGPLLPSALSVGTRDAYRILGATLSVNKPSAGSARSVLVTGANAGDGKSTSALNLATALSRKDTVMLAEIDSRRPVLARALGLNPEYGLTSVLDARIPLADALVEAGAPARNLRVLLPLPTEAPLSAVMTPPRADWLIRQAQLLANWVIFDGPPLTMMADALPIATQVDDVIVVVRLGNTRLKTLEELAELLIQQGHHPGRVRAPRQPQSGKLILRLLSNCTAYRHTW